MSISLRGVDDGLDPVPDGVEIMRIDDAGRSGADGLQVGYPGPEPIGHQSQVRGLAAFAGAQDLVVGHSMVQEHGLGFRRVETDAHTGTGALAVPRVAVNIGNPHMGQSGPMPTGSGFTGPCNPSEDVPLPSGYMPAVT